jgi:hypothetical protein
MALDHGQERRLANAARKALSWRQTRDAEIVSAHRSGAGLREIARATRLTHPAIKRIVEKSHG